MAWTTLLACLIAAGPLFYDHAIGEPELAGRSLDELRLMRNTIYARSGRVFTDPKLREYFSHQPWYAPRTASTSGAVPRLSAVDKANIRAIAEQEKRLLNAAITVPCAEAGADGKPIDPRIDEELSTAARQLKWDSYGPPKPCHRRVQLACGPDVDGDGQPEAIVHITWRTLLNGTTCRTIRDSNDYWDTGVTFLVSGRAGKWRAVGPLGIDIEGDQQDEHSSAWFVRRRDGELAIRASTTNVSSDTMCTIGSYTVWRLRNGKLVALETGDNSEPCP
jgi:hypothetical protein